LARIDREDDRLNPRFGPSRSFWFLKRCIDCEFMFQFKGL
jgi:hypothetical protein